MAVPTTSTHQIVRKFPAQETWDRLEKNSVSNSSKHDLETQPDFLPLFTNHLNSSAASTSEPPFSMEKRKIIAGESVERCTPWRTKEYNCDPIGLHEEKEVADRISQIFDESGRKPMSTCLVAS